jgi:hypothetical protein
MNEPSAIPPIIPAARPPPVERTLRRLFLTLFLRGRSARGLRKDAAPKSVGSKLASTLFFYALFGLFALFFVQRPVFGLALYLHGMTLVFLGMFVASSAGEVLFNKEEADILLHRPILPRVLLWSKIGVLVRVSLWLAGAFNLAGCFVGLAAPDGTWRFPLVHLGSTALEALFCTGCVVLTYQLCLRWFGREKLDSLLTTTQVIVAIIAVVSGQVVPQLLNQFGNHFSPSAAAWWVYLVPPAWFAGLDDALGGSSSSAAWVLAGLASGASLLVLGLAFGRLAQDYERGLQTINEGAPTKARPRARRQWLEKLVHTPPFSWWLRHPVERASFRLTVAYLARDRDVKLRVYPGVAPMLVMPVIFLARDLSQTPGAGFGSGFGIAFTGCYIGLIPLFAQSLLQYSQQWQASDLFRVAPMSGPAPLCHGARRAVLCCLAFPVLLLFTLAVFIMPHQPGQLLLLLPGIVAVPVYSLLPTISGKAVPLSLPVEEAKSAGRGLVFVGVMFFSMALAGISLLAWSTGWFWWFLLVEVVVAAALYVALRHSLGQVRWSPLA